MMEIIQAAKQVQDKLDECYSYMKMLEEQDGAARSQARGDELVCHGIAMALAIIKETNAVYEWRECKNRFDPSSEMFNRQKQQYLEIMNS